MNTDEINIRQIAEMTETNGWKEYKKMLSLKVKAFDEKLTFGEGLNTKAYSKERLIEINAMIQARKIIMEIINYPETLKELIDEQNKAL